jgi:act minimal PKS acyl carrier protein
MSEQEFTLDDLKRTLRAAAGEDESADLEGDIIDLEFAELGYDSLALLETASLIEQDRGIALEDSMVSEARTPRLLIDFVNQQMVAA